VPARRTPGPSGATGGPGGERGFTLIELVVAMSILAVAVGGLISAFGSALRTTAIDIHRTDAIALADGELARLRAQPYDSLASGSSMPPPIKGQAYQITDTVGAATASDHTAGAYRSVRVAVAWADQAGPHTVVQDGAVYPGGFGPDGGALGSTTTTTGPCKPPASGPAPTVDVPPPAPPAPGPPSVQVSWVEPAPGPTTAAAVRWQVATSSDGTTWTTAAVTDGPLPAGATHRVEVGGLAPNTAYQAMVIAVGPCGDSVPSPPGPPGPLTAAGGSGCTAVINTPVAPRVGAGADPAALAGTVTVTMTQNASCSNPLTATVVPSIGNPLVVPLLPAGSATASALLSSPPQPWDLGRHTVLIGDGGPSPLAIVDLCVVNAGVSSC